MVDNIFVYTPPFGEVGRLISDRLISIDILIDVMYRYHLSDTDLLVK